ncbi:addiction module toxin RelE [Citrobacter amalonaticus]|uniref:Addiction module toxin RelE n=1 Tax=Citrobacter amalonaticus TaxID=35703 RepID=A0A2S4RTG1_CITAM|nr:addiction module toxin RelE [Citrobacter amalonaticus]POT71930.1 addiction module toxin RelE [Citrobacter amalonaticus]POU63069.1 addiction module toxin RelE [Citrobacter amalonaticus]POV04717.1 addiction module toxin RelE [Citrobacter amalonaticus]
MPLLFFYDLYTQNHSRCGKGANPQERTSVRDRGERLQPTQRQLE